MADKIVAEYTVKVDEAVKNLNRLEKEVKDLSTKGKKSASDIESNFKKTSSSLISQFSRVGAALGVAFGTAQLVAFGKEAVQVAAKSEGIARAFEKLNNPNLLNDLRKATRGTITDLQLMQAAVRAKNFKIPLEQLAGFFQFATNRAIETGESVDYLVDSIINGIGRKSSLVLDNLGISATELQEEMKKTGDFGAAAGNIIARELGKAGDVADTTAVKVAQISTAFENFKVDVGKELISTFSDLNTEVQETLELFDIDGVDAFSLALSALKHVLDDLTAPFKLLNNTLRIVGEQYQKLKDKFGGEETKEEAELIEKLQNSFANMRRLIDESKEAEEEKDEVVQEVIKNLKFYNDLIEELQTKQKKANTTRAEVRQLEDEINEAIRQRLILLGRLREVGGASMQQIETIAASELDVQKTLTDDIIADYAYRNGEIEAAQDELNKMLAKKAQEQREQKIQEWNGYAGQVSNIIGSISQIQANAYAYEQQELDNQLKSELITREEYDRKRAELAKENFKKDKEAKLIQASINTALGVTNAIATAPNIVVGLILAAVAAAAGAAEIGVIASQPTPQFAEGGLVKEHGLLKGKSHAKGGIKVEAEGDEFFVNKKATKKHLSLLNAINDGVGQEWINKNMVYPAIQNVIDSGVESNLGNWGNVTASLKDHNIIASQDRMRQSMTHGFKYLAKELKGNNIKRGGYNA